MLFETCMYYFDKLFLPNMHNLKNKTHQLSLKKLGNYILKESMKSILDVKRILNTCIYYFDMLLLHYMNS